MILDLPVGRALHRFRRLNSIKQGHVAELLNVSQGSVSRWESGTNEPEVHHRERIFAMIAAQANNDADAALRRLVCSSTMAVHLVCDATHRLLAASPSRVASWGSHADDYIGRSLWPFASPEIMTAEVGLRDRGWFEQPGQRLRFHTGSNNSDVVIVHPSVMQWETVPLADGRVGRLTSTIE